ncbi:hypothetical protein [Bosea sp. PAMC 26642]|uniref:hypothetical protein n=1 Tax=Bosea sp. (strain PAMC 26642) TaxID=1792307 RepID=UPI0012E74212|nr:hypothetical protein [Bosea sp. PAMC 26642]
MCLPTGYENAAFYLLAAVVFTTYFFVARKILNAAKAKAIDPMPYRNSMLISLQLYKQAKFEAQTSASADDRTLILATKRRLTLLSLATCVIGVGAIFIVFNCQFRALQSRGQSVAALLSVEPDAHNGRHAFSSQSFASPSTSAARLLQTWA